MSSHMFVRIFAISAALSLLGEAGAEGPSRVVVDVTPDGSPAEVLELLGDALGAQMEADVLGVDAFLERGAGNWAVTAPASLERCGTEPVTTEDIQLSMAEIEQAMYSLEYGEAQIALVALADRLCNAVEPLSADLLARIPYLQGISRFYAQDPAAARSLFRRAVELQPALAWDETFAPEPRQLFLAALSDTVQSSRTVVVLDGVERPPRLVLDGAVVSADRSEVLLLGERHLLQVGGDDGQVFTFTLDTGQAERVHIVGATRVRTGLAGIPDDPVAFDAVVAVAAERGYSEVLVRAPGSEELWRYNDIERSWSRVSLVLGQRLASARRTQAAGSVLLGVGAAVAITGAVIGGTNHARGQDVAGEMFGPDGELSGGLYDLYNEDYERYRHDMQVGWALMVAGGVVAAIGGPLLIQGRCAQNAAQQDSGVAVLPTPGGVVVAGRF